MHCNNNTTKNAEQQHGRGRSVSSRRSSDTAGLKEHATGSSSKMSVCPLSQTLGRAGWLHSLAALSGLVGLADLPWPAMTCLGRGPSALALPAEAPPDELRVQASPPCTTNDAADPTTRMHQCRTALRVLWSPGRSPFRQRHRAHCFAPVLTCVLCCTASRLAILLYPPWKLRAPGPPQSRPTPQSHGIAPVTGNSHLYAKEPRLASESTGTSHGLLFLQYTYGRYRATCTISILIVTLSTCQMPKAPPVRSSNFALCMPLRPCTAPDTRYPPIDCSPAAINRPTDRPNDRHHERERAHRARLILFGGSFEHSGHSQSPTGSSLMPTHSQ